MILLVYIDVYMLHSSGKLTGVSGDSLLATQRFCFAPDLAVGFYPHELFVLIKIMVMDRRSKVSGINLSLIHI